MQKAAEISRKTFLSSINDDFSLQIIRKKKFNQHSAPLKQAVANKWPHETTELVMKLNVITAKTETHLLSSLSLQADFRCNSTTCRLIESKVKTQYSLAGRSVVVR